MTQEFPEQQIQYLVRLLRSEEKPFELFKDTGKGMFFANYQTNIKDNQTKNWETQIERSKGKIQKKLTQ